jgi:branched-chain amino acid aminotransferase
VQENKLYSPEKFAAGLRLSIAQGLKRNSPDALNPAWKTGNYLNNILCLHEARARGADEVVICNQRGEITEAAVSNIAFVANGTCITPPLSSGILAGITRKLLLEVAAPAAGVPIQERPVRPEELGRMEECFLLSSTKDVTPVAQIDDVKFRVGAGTIALKLKQAFAQAVASYNAAHPELRVF